MFGIWRTLLAIEVVAQHLLLVPVIGFYAVFSFFVLSGFLMTAIMHTTYGYGAAGFLRYLGNRALRLYPSYWFALIVTIILIMLVGGDVVARYNPAMALPESAREWIQNLTIIFWNFIPKEEYPRLVPLAWALTVEIVFYIVIGLGASRTPLRTWLWLVVSVGYVGAIRHLYPQGGGYLYEAIGAGSLPFSVGALAWHYRVPVKSVLDRLRVSDARVLVAGRWALYGAIMVLQGLTGWKWLVMAGNWLNILISALIVCALFATRPAPALRHVDKRIGDYSYPIYLLHLQMGLAAGLILYGVPQAGSAGIFVLGLALTIALGTVCTAVIDPAVERLRNRVKQRPSQIASA